MCYVEIKYLRNTTERYLQAVVNDYEFICDQYEQSSFFVCNDCESKMAMFAITRNYVGSDVHVMLGLRLRFQQVVVAYEIFDGTDVVGERLGK